MVRTFIKTGRGGGSKAIYKFYKKTDVLVLDVVPKWMNWIGLDGSLCWATIRAALCDANKTIVRFFEFS